MRQVRWASWTLAVAMGVTLGSLQPAAGDVSSDRAAAIVTYPLVQVSLLASDTVLQLSNTSNDPIDVLCFYENANSHCTNTGRVCFDPADCCDSSTGCGVCQPGWNETDFRVRLTPRQPIAWRASKGLANFPLSGAPPPFGKVGIGGSSNAGSRIPPVPEEPFVGALKCLAVDATGIPIDRNVLKGEATLTAFSPAEEDNGPSSLAPSIDVWKYNAVGIQAIPGGVNDDRTLVLGGEGAEYNGCPNVTIVNHFFDFAEDPANPTNEAIRTRLTLVPCSQDLRRQIPGSAVVQYLVYNEFEQRFSTSRIMQCQQYRPLSLIDTTQPTRSIFSVGVAGTLTGQTRLTPIGSGLLAVAEEAHDFGSARTGAFNVHFQGDRPSSDLIVLP